MKVILVQFLLKKTPKNKREIFIQYYIKMIVVKVLTGEESGRGAEENQRNGGKTSRVPVCIKTGFSSKMQTSFFDLFCPYVHSKR